MTIEHNKKFNFRFGDKKVVFSQMSYESAFHLHAKVLAFALFHEKFPTLRVEVKLEDRYQPDLCALDYDGKMLFWGECGNVSIDKIEKLFKKYRQAHFVFVKEERDLNMFQKHMEKMAKDLITRPKVDIVIYPEFFHEWCISEEGDVFINPQDVTIIPWHDPDAPVDRFKPRSER